MNSCLAGSLQGEEGKRSVAGGGIPIISHMRMHFSFFISLAFNIHTNWSNNNNNSTREGTEEEEEEKLNSVEQLHSLVESICCLEMDGSSSSESISRSIIFLCMSLSLNSEKEVIEECLTFSFIQMHSLLPLLPVPKWLNCTANGRMPSRQRDRERWREKIKKILLLIKHHPDEWWWWWKQLVNSN